MSLFDKKVLRNAKRFIYVTVSKFYETQKAKSWKKFS